MAVLYQLLGAVVRAVSRGSSGGGGSGGGSSDANEAAVPPPPPANATNDNAAAAAACCQSSVDVNHQAICSTSAADAAAAECWICLSGPELAPLEQACACPSSRAVHRRCLARWQLQQAGKREETHCRFCGEHWRCDWKTSLRGRLGLQEQQPRQKQQQGGTAATTAAVAAGDDDDALQQQPPPLPLRPTTPVMAICFDGRVHRIKVRPGPEGRARFEREVRALLQLRDDEQFEIGFECRLPDASGQLLQLEGMEAFDAATHCAAVTAAERAARKARKQAAAAAAAAAASGAAPAGAIGAAQPQQQPQQQQRRQQQQEQLRQRQAVAA